MAHARNDADRLRLESELAEARRRYEALRRRKAVRAALAVAKLGVLARAGRDALAPSSPAPQADAPATVAEPSSAPDAPPAATPEAPPTATPDAPPGAAPDAPPAAAQHAPPTTAPAAPPEQDPGPALAPPDTVAHCWPLGHFYSPVPDTPALRREPTRSRVWPPTPPETPGIDWRDDEQVALVRELAEQVKLEFPTESTGDPIDYHTGNEMFSRLDAWALQAMLRKLRPARMIEVGSGWSSLVAARVNRDFLDGAMDLTCVEPYPADFLEAGVPGIARLLRMPVQDVSLDRFAELGAGDVLFIDSSHVAKTGSDCNYLYHDVLPRLQPGVVIHVHDIFLPFDYPEEWVFSGRSWNEQYVLRAFLAFNTAFEILLGNVWMSHRHPELLAEAAFGEPSAALTCGGGSMWLRRT